MTGIEAQAMITRYSNLLEEYRATDDYESIANCLGMLGDAYFYNAEYMQAKKAAG